MSLSKMNFTICVKPTQGGKTSEMIYNIENKMKKDETEGKSLHIVVGANITNIQNQITGRTMKFFNMHEDNIVELNSKKNTKNTVTNIIELEHRLVMKRGEDVKIILMLCNKVRKENIVNIVSLLDDEEQNIRKYKRVYFYFDEIHSYIETNRSFIDELKEFSIVKDIFGYTATPFKIWEPENPNWDTVQMIELFNEINEDLYVGCKDMIWNTEIINMELKPLENIRNILMQENLLEDNNRILIVGERTNVSHDAIKEIVFTINPNAVVCVLNTKNKCLCFDNKIVSLDNQDCKEFGRKIYEIMEENNKLDEALVITGNICIGIGQTFGDSKLGNLTHGIFPIVNNNKDQNYQQFGRLTGPYKKNDNYVPPTVYCQSLFKDNCIDLEYCALNLSNFQNAQIPLEVYKAKLIYENNNIVKKRRSEKAENSYQGEIPIFFSIDKKIEDIVNIKAQLKNKPVERGIKYAELFKTLSFNNKQQVMAIMDEYHLKYEDIIDSFTGKYYINMYNGCREKAFQRKPFGSLGLFVRNGSNKQMRLFFKANENDIDVVLCYYDWSKSDVQCKEKTYKTKERKEKKSKTTTRTTVETVENVKQQQPLTTIRRVSSSSSLCSEENDNLTIKTTDTNQTTKSRARKFTDFAENNLEDGEQIRFTMKKYNIDEYATYVKQTGKVMYKGEEITLHQLCVINYRKETGKTKAFNVFDMSKVLRNGIWIAINKINNQE